MALLLAGFGVSVGVGAALIYRATLHEADEIFDYHMEQVAGTLISGQPPRSKGTPAAGGARVEEDLDLLVRVESPDGSVLHESPGWPIESNAMQPGFHDGKRAGTPYRIYVHSTAERTVRVAQDVLARRELARDLAFEALSPLLLLVPILLFAGWWLVRWSVAPLERTRAQISKRAVSDLSALPAVGLPEEVVPLVEEINLLFERLRRAFDAQSAFVADAAHELRSPLAALRVQAQILQKANDPESRDTALRRLMSGLERLTRLMEQMLALAREEASAGAKPAPHPVALRALAQEVVVSLAMLATDKDIDLGFAAGPEVEVPGDPSALRALIQNLVENAIKYTPRAGTVDVSVGVSDGGPWLAVEDSGPGIAAAERERVFSRFYRVPGNDATGSGLGLAIVRTVAQAHGARVALETSPSHRGLRVVVRFG